MSPAMAIADHSWPDEDAFVEVIASPCVSIPVACLQRSIDFYARLFGFRALRDGCRAADGRTIPGRGGHPGLALQEQPQPPVSGEPVNRLAVAVERLERAREIVWDLGIPAVRDIDEPERMALRTRRSFVIRDPDGNEIEIFERSNQSEKGRTRICAVP